MMSSETKPRAVVVRGSEVRPGEGWFCGYRTNIPGGSVAACEGWIRSNPDHPSEFLIAKRPEFQDGHYVVMRPFAPSPRYEYAIVDLHARKPATKPSDATHAGWVAKPGLALDDPMVKWPTLGRLVDYAFTKPGPERVLAKLEAISKGKQILVDAAHLERTRALLLSVAAMPSLDKANYAEIAAVLRAWPGGKGGGK